MICAHHPDIKNQKICGINQTLKKVLQRYNFQGMEVIGARFPSAKNCWFPNVRINASQSWIAVPEHWNHIGSTGSQFEELQVLKGSNQCFPILEPWVPCSRNCWFTKVGTNASQSWNCGLRVLGASGSQSLELMRPNLGASGSQF